MNKVVRLEDNKAGREWTFQEHCGFISPVYLLIGTGDWTQDLACMRQEFYH